MISAGELATMRREVQRTFVHTYTLTPRVEGADDPYGDPTLSDGTAVPRKPCKYRERSTAVVGTNGVEVVNIGSLLVPSSDTIKPGDKVSQVTDAYGTVFVAGPVEVEDVSPSGTIAGGALHLEARLRQIQTV